MRKICLAVCLVTATSFLTGCTASKKPQQQAMSMMELRSAYEELFSQPSEEEREVGHRILAKARTALGTPYVRGGRNPGGFDCSGLVQWAYRHEGIKLPRTAREQSVVGKKISRIEEMQAGDIVAFRHPRRGYHTGIYVGDGKFIHSPTRRDRVKISSLNDDYFRRTFLGARRVSSDGSNALLQAESQLADNSGQEARMTEYRAEQAVREIQRSRKDKKKTSVKAERSSSKKKNVSSRNKKRSKKEVSASRKSKSKKAAVAKKKQSKSKVKTDRKRSSSKASQRKSSSKKTKQSSKQKKSNKT